MRLHPDIIPPMNMQALIFGVDLDDGIDKEYKPGLFLQVNAFLEREDRFFCTLSQQSEHMVFYNKIAGY